MQFNPLSFQHFSLFNMRIVHHFNWNGQQLDYGGDQAYAHALAANNEKLDGTCGEATHSLEVDLKSIHSWQVSENVLQHETKL